jgi:hypothetical protein
VLTSFFHFVAEHWVLVLKLASLAITGILGVVGLLNDFKDKNGKLTKWGKISLWGLVFAAFVSLATEIRGYVEQAEQAQQQAKRAQQREDQMRSLLGTANATEAGVTKVLEKNQEVQSIATETLKRQSSLFNSSQNTLREVERGLTPLGAEIAIAFEVAVPISDHRFDELRRLIDVEIAKFEARDPVAKDWGPIDRMGNTSYSTQGVTFRANLHRERARWIDWISLDPLSPLIYEAGGWPQFTLTQAPFDGLKMWPRETVLANCNPSIDSDVAFAVDTNAGSEAGTARRAQLGITYSPQQQKMTLHGTLPLHREKDSSRFVSTLDLGGSLVGLRVKNPGIVLGNGFLTRSLTLYIGHWTVLLDPSHPVEQCDDLYFRLPMR